MNKLILVTLILLTLSFVGCGNLNIKKSSVLQEKIGIIPTYKFEKEYYSFGNILINSIQNELERSGIQIDRAEKIEETARQKNLENEYNIAQSNGIGLFKVEEFLNKLGDKYYFFTVVEIKDVELENKRFWENVFSTPLLAISFLTLDFSLMPKHEKIEPIIDFSKINENSIISNKYEMNIEMHLMTDKVEEIENIRVNFKNYDNERIVQEKVKETFDKIAKELVEKIKYDKRNGE